MPVSSLLLVGIVLWLVALVPIVALLYSVGERDLDTYEAKRVG